MPNEVMRDRYYSNIRSKLSFLVTEIHLDNSVNLQTLNIHAENIFAGVLNILYGWSLKNANAVEQNAAGIDLFDADNKVVVQVSSKHTHKKIQEESIDKIAKQTVGDGDPTPKYEGYHYYFLAIAKDAKTTKAFTVPSWLTFDYKNDILDLTTLLSRVLSASAETQQKLSDFLDREMSSEAATRRMKTVAEDTPLSERNPFRYDAETVSFVGRDVEMERLYAFLDGTAPFRWWAIVGPGGSGKTRLAYELKKELDEDGEWIAEFLGENDYVEIERLSNDDFNKRYPKKTLLIADHVQQHTKGLGCWMNRLSSGDLRRNNPIRLILIERDTGIKNGQYAWETQIYNAAVRALPIREKRYAEIMRLQPLDYYRNESSLLQVILTFAESLRLREPELSKLTNEDALMLLRDTRRLDPSLHRPLFALFLTDAFLHHQNSKEMRLFKLFEYTTSRELDLLKGAIMNLAPKESLNEKLFYTCCFLWRVATAMGGAGDTNAELLLHRCKAEKKLLAKYADEYNLRSTEDLLLRVGLLERGNFAALRPDILGEFLVFEWLTNPSTDRNDISRFFSILLQDCQSSYIFMQRLFNDFEAEFIKDLSRLDFLCPGTLKIDDGSAHALSKILDDICLGRNTEQDQLIDFVSDERKFCWWAIVGPAASGKTRLATVLKQELTKSPDWVTESIIFTPFEDMMTLTDRIVDENPSILQKNLLIIADEADYHRQETCKLFRSIEKLSKRSDHQGKIRLLLLYRYATVNDVLQTIEQETIQSAVYEFICNYVYDIPLLLGPVDNNTIKLLLRLYSISRNLSNPQLHLLSEEQENDIVQVMNSMPEFKNNVVLAMLYALKEMGYFEHESSTFPRSDNIF